MIRSFFQAAIASILLYGCTTWTLTKPAGEEARRQLHKNAASNLEQVLAATPHKDTNCTATCLLSRKLFKLDEQTCRTLLEKQDELISDVLLWTPHMAEQKQDDQHEPYIQQLCKDTGCSPEDLPEAMNRQGKVARESQGYPCYQHDMMMMKYVKYQLIRLQIKKKKLEN